ncbi:hypothetical protein [Halobacillus litoralis]|uniref:hypothetical protein n=1 Tax=Halobacillus litoralis TaxID=45668 RepID=UPI001CD1AA7F|nr:hypothetical protein [Halobacillus litoralis]MCA1021629.1 hypothetical protein [Halobacillus litoralis]
MAYKTNISKEFKNKGLYNPEEHSLTSTKKNTEGEVFDLLEVLEKIASNGDEIEFSVVVKESYDDIEGVDGE